MLLQREVMKEYDETFVYKKLFSTRLDKSVQTNEGEWDGVLRNEMYVADAKHVQPKCFTIMITLDKP